MDSRVPWKGDWTTDTKLLKVTQVISIAWLVVLVDPSSRLFGAHLSPFLLVLTVLGVVTFSGVYIWVVLLSNPYPGTSSPESPRDATLASRSHQEMLGRCLPIALLTAFGVLYTIRYGNPWLDLLVFAGVATAFRLPIRYGVFTILGIALLAAILAIGINRSTADAGSAFLMIVSIGIGVAGGIYTRAMLRELRAAREELARLAVAEERLRFARDLHDLLGHSLSLIALKSELAGQLALRSPERAAAEIHDVESVAREALREVREAVAGYRQPTLRQELGGATEILGAAGISCEVVGELGGVPPRLEAVFAWAVREGVTNVIRHSRARSCAIRLTRTDRQASVEVVDDGVGLADPNAPGSGGRSGLAGLTERVASVGGQVIAGPETPRGFRLLTTIPLASEAESNHKPSEPARVMVTGGNQ